MARKPRTTSVLTPPTLPGVSPEPRSGKKLVNVQVSAEAHKHMRLFKAHMDWSNDEIIERAIMEMYRQYPGYEPPSELDRVA